MLDLNDNSIRIRRLGNGLLIFCNLQVLGVILVYKQTKQNLVSPIIPQNISCEIYEHYVNAGIFAAVGLLAMILLKLYNKNLLVVLAGILNVIGYSLMLHFAG